jgi:hypothetical protein
MRVAFTEEEIGRLWTPGAKDDMRERMRAGELKLITSAVMIWRSRKNSGTGR